MVKLSVFKWRLCLHIVTLLVFLFCFRICPNWNDKDKYSKRQYIDDDDDDDDDKRSLSFVDKKYLV